MSWLCDLVGKRLVSAAMSFFKQRIRKRWKILSIVAGLWLWVLFPIPFLPLFNAPYDPTSIRVSLIIVSIASIPFTLLALFMNSGRTQDEQLWEKGLRYLHAGRNDSGWYPHAPIVELFSHFLAERIWRFILLVSQPFARNSLLIEPAP